MPEQVRSMTPAEFSRFTRGAHQREKFEMRQTAQLLSMLDSMKPPPRGRRTRTPKSAKSFMPWAFAPDWPDEDDA